MTVVRGSAYLIPTLKDDPADAEAISHRLLVRAGFVRQVGAGLYTYLPLGWRVMRTVMDIVRDEMNTIGLEWSMPVLNPAELWQQTGRYGIEALFKLRGHLRQAVRACPVARGGDHLPRRARAAQLPRPAPDLVPHPDQGAGRAAAQERHPAHPRVHHEGRLQLRPRRGGAGGELPAAHRGLQADLRPQRPDLLDGRVRRRHDGRLRRARVHGAQLGRRGRGGALLERRLRGQRRARRVAAAHAAVPGAARRARRDRDTGDHDDRGAGPAPGHRFRRDLQGDGAAP